MSINENDSFYSYMVIILTSERETFPSGPVKYAVKYDPSGFIPKRNINIATLYAVLFQCSIVGKRINQF